MEKFKTERGITDDFTPVQLVEASNFLTKELYAHFTESAVNRVAEVHWDPEIDDVTSPMDVYIEGIYHSDPELNCDAHAISINTQPTVLISHPAIPPPRPKDPYVDSDSISTLRS